MAQRNDGKAFEELVTKIQSNLAPDAEIKVNHKILGKNSKTKREVDILIQQKMGNYDIKVVVECKDFKQPLNVKQVEATIGLIQDVGANLGVIVAANGFTKAALTRGLDAQLKLYKLIDTGNHNWKADIGLPSICIVKNLQSFSFTIQYLDNRSIPHDHPLVLYKGQQEIVLPQAMLLDWWFSKNDEIATGYHENIEFIEEDIFFMIEGEPFRAKIKANIQVEEILFFRIWPLSEISGFEDQSNKIIETNGFTLSSLTLDILKKNWIRITNSNNLSIKPIITVDLATCANLI